MKIALPMSHLITGKTINQIPVDVYEMRDQPSKIFMFSNAPLVWHSSLGCMKRLFLHQFELWAKKWGKRVPLYSCTLGPAVRDYQIVDGLYKSANGNGPMNKEDIKKWFMALVRNMREVYGGEIAFENTNGYPYPEYVHVSEPAFIRELLKETDTYMILDIAHAMITSHYAKINFSDYVSQLDSSRIIGVHLSRPEMIEGKIWDAHLYPTNWIFDMFRVLRKYIPRDAYVAIEYYGDFEKLKECYETLREIVNG